VVVVVLDRGVGGEQGRGSLCSGAGPSELWDEFKDGQ
jgi:hypothetical protein